MLKLIFIFTVIPLIELLTLIKLSQIWGVLITIALVAVTGLTGAILTKRQGTTVVRKIQQSLSEGIMPADSLIDGLLILIGGVLLITPGLLTDLAGFSCIIPFSRNRVKLLTRNRFNKLIQKGTINFSNPEGKQEQSFDVTDDRPNN